MERSILWSGIACICFFVLGIVTGLDISEQTCENRIDAIYESHQLNK